MFKAEKTTQLAAEFLKAAGGQIPYVVLLKMLYLADREMLLRHGTPITFDRWYAMKRGPVLSTTFDIIKGKRHEQYWERHIKTQGYNAVLMEYPGNDELSRAELRIAEEIFQKQNINNKQNLVRETYDSSEYVDPRVGADEITYRAVLEVEGLPLTEIDKIIENIDAENFADRILLGA